jgi:hypothetical protein
MRYCIDYCRTSLANAALCVIHDNTAVSGFSLNTYHQAATKSRKKQKIVKTRSLVSPHPYGALNNGISHTTHPCTTRHSGCALGAISLIPQSRASSQQTRIKAKKIETQPRFYLQM